MLQDLRDLGERITEMVPNNNIFCLEIQDCGLVRPRVSEVRWWLDMVGWRPVQKLRGDIRNEGDGIYSQN